jgi:aspartokinase
MNIAEITHRYISERPSIKDCLKRGLINYSALAREICLQLDNNNFDAVLVACRRYIQRIRTNATHEKRITDLVRRARIRLRNQISIVIIEKPRDFERIYRMQREIKATRGDFHLVEGEDSLTLITNTEYIPGIRESFKGRIKQITENQVQITMIFDAKIETTSGVVAFIYSLMAENGINVREEMSCWTDLMMVLDEHDAAKAMRVLSPSKELR